MSFDYLGPYQIDVSGSFDVTDKVCPLQPFQVAQDVSGNESLICMKCVKDKCMLWNANTGPTDDAFMDNANVVNPYWSTDTSSETNSDGGRCGLKSSGDTELIYKLAHHIHKQHLHSSLHLDPKIASTSSGSGPGIFNTRAQTLLQEFLNFTDLDSDGKIYGTDFQIEDNTSGVDNKPPMLRSIDINSGTKVQKQVPWSYYNSDIGPLYPVQITSVYPNSGDVSGDYYVRIKGHFIVDDTTSVDVSGSTFAIIIDDIELTGFEFEIINENLMYIKIPVLTGQPEGKVNILIENVGDTFNTGRSTGSPRTFVDRFQFLPDGTDSGIQTELEAEILINVGYLF